VPLRVSWSFKVEPTLAAPRRSRDALRPLRNVLAPEVFFNLRLVVSELVTNSVKYGPRRPIRVLLRVEDGTVAGEVHDQGAPAPAFRVAQRLDAEAAGGLGLPLLDALATRWGVREGSTHVWFELAAR
jgi:anti-sigma regulatory factor (Ser/Thr protein kinase)